MRSLSPELVLCVLIPIAVGALFGVFVRRTVWPRVPLLFAASVVSAIVVCIVLYVWDLVWLGANPHWRSPSPIYVQALAGTMLFAPGIFLFGMLPAMGGCLLSLLGRKAAHS